MARKRCEGTRDGPRAVSTPRSSRWSGAAIPGSPLIVRAVAGEELYTLAMLPLPLQSHQDDKNHQRNACEASHYAPDERGCCGIKGAATRCTCLSRGGCRQSSKRCAGSPSPSPNADPGTVAVAENRSSGNLSSGSQKCGGRRMRSGGKTGRQASIRRNGRLCGGIDE